MPPGIPYMPACATCTCRFRRRWPADESLLRQSLNETLREPARLPTPSPARCLANVIVPISATCCNQQKSTVSTKNHQPRFLTTTPSSTHTVLYCSPFCQTTLPHQTVPLSSIRSVYPQRLLVHAPSPPHQLSTFPGRPSHRAARRLSPALHFPFATNHIFGCDPFIASVLVYMGRQLLLNWDSIFTAASKQNCFSPTRLLQWECCALVKPIPWVVITKSLHLHVRFSPIRVISPHGCTWIVHKSPLVTRDLQVILLVLPQR